jgi:4-alpha-glucanotransferase
MRRESGVLMHVSSLFGNYSCGGFGAEARYFVDFLCESGFSVWQVLPFCMPDEYGSPYKSYSAFGANPYFIDLPTLYEAGLLTAEELTEARQESPYLCEQDRLAEERLALLARAAARVEDRSEVLRFVGAHPELARAAEFLALKDANGGCEWQNFTVTSPDPERLFCWQFIQYEFFRQWQTVKQYANERGIRIVGDVPIYVAADSADVWAHREQFLLDGDGHPRSVAGVPPDYFSEDGQLWGNPLYDWKRMKADGYRWWRERISYMLTLFDGVRIDHFRGFESFFSIPAEAKSAKAGRWVKGPGRALIDAIREEAGDKLIIAEDLGDITPAVGALLKYSGFPGMRVFQFGFLGDPNTPHLPYRYCEHSVAYSGTHDNNTLLGYVWEMTPENRRRVFDYCGNASGDFAEGVRNIVRTVMMSASALAVFPIQDILGFGSDTRMNTPGVAKGNWCYRITKEQLDSIDRAELLRYNRLYGRKA